MTETLKDIALRVLDKQFCWIKDPCRQMTIGDMLGYAEALVEELGKQEAVACTEAGVLNWIANRETEDTTDLYAAPVIPAGMVLVPEALHTEFYNLRKASMAVVARWDTPLWKDVPATAEYINQLRNVLENEDD